MRTQHFYDHPYNLTAIGAHKSTINSTNSPLPSPKHPTTSASVTMSAPPVSTGSTKLDAVKQNVAAAAPQKLSGLQLYSRFAFAGAVCCSLTHGGLTPVDV